MIITGNARRTRSAVRETAAQIARLNVRLAATARWTSGAAIMAYILLANAASFVVLKRANIITTVALARYVALGTLVLDDVRDLALLENGVHQI